MSTSNLVEARPRLVDDSIGSALQPPLTRTLALAARATLEVIGLLSVLAVFALAVSPALRTAVGQIGSDIWSYFGPSAISGEEPDAERGLAKESGLGQPVNLDSAGDNAAVYLAKRYHVADRAVRYVVAAAQSAGKDTQLDPLLILAVMAIESSMNPFAQSPVGATGLMQVMPDLHGAKFAEQDSRIGALDPSANIKAGSRILGDLIRRGGSVERGLQLYVGAGNAPDDGGYANRVLAEFERLRMAARGGVAAALAAGLRSDARASGEAGTPMTSAAPAESHPQPAQAQRDT